MKTHHYNIKIQPRNPWVDILISELDVIGFDSFQETDSGVEAYVSDQELKEDPSQFLEKFSKENDIEIQVEHQIIDEQNWNAEWESSFSPVEVGSFCNIRAPFHSFKEGFDHEVVIMPKMSFGTGHHPTTYLMVSAMKELSFEAKKVLDMGSGTGVLAILACKLQAEEVFGIDIEDWAVENAIENAKVNREEAKFELGGKEKIGSFKADIVLANINRNILLDQIEEYAKCLKSGGVLLLSGFMIEDVPVIEKKANSNALKKVELNNKDNWTCLKFQKD